MKKLLKKDREAYARDAAILIWACGFQPDPLCPEDFRVVTDAGVFIVHPPKAEHQFSMFSLNGRFAEPLTALNAGVDCNPFTGKWNILHSDAATVLQEFGQRMKRLNARAPHSGELDEQDAAELRRRDEWRKATATL